MQGAMDLYKKKLQLLKKKMSMLEDMKKPDDEGEGEGDADENDEAAEPEAIVVAEKSTAVKADPTSMSDEEIQEMLAPKKKEFKKEGVAFAFGKSPLKHKMPMKSRK